MYQDSEQGFCSTAVENAGHFVDCLCGSEYVDDFLRQDEKFYARNIQISKLENDCYIHIVTDIDGGVIEWKALNGIKHPVRHITVMVNDQVIMRRISPTLKKHVYLPKYSSNQLKNFEKCLGFQLLYEYGWECWYGFVPDENVDTVALDSTLIRSNFYSSFCELRHKLSKRLKEAGLNRQVLNTLMKNNLNNVRKLTILPNDSPGVLRLLQEVIDSLSNPYGFKKIIFSFRFGEKLSECMMLTEYDCNEIRVYDIDLLWSRAGLQSLVGERGTLTTCLSFVDCGNFQTNLDGRIIDISPLLRSVCNYPFRLRFLQLYADIPHLKPNTRFHPA